MFIFSLFYFALLITLDALWAPESASKHHMSGAGLSINGHPGLMAQHWNQTHTITTGTPEIFPAVTAPAVTTSATFDLYDLAENMRPFTIAIGGAALKGSAASNPSTGYEWMVDADSLHKCGPEGSIIVTKTFVMDDAPENYTGVGGTTHFSITATDKAKSGSACRIGFNHDQPWNVREGW